MNTGQAKALIECGHDFHWRADIVENAAASASPVLGAGGFALGHGGSRLAQHMAVGSGGWSGPRRLGSAYRSLGGLATVRQGRG